MSFIARTPPRLQGNPAECGAVCLGIILEHFGVFFSALELRRCCSINRNGATISQIQRGAQSLGYSCNVFKRGIKALRKAEMPLILHWNLTHFVVLEGIEGKTAWVNDPGVGRRKISIDELDRSYSGICIAVHDKNIYLEEPRYKHTTKSRFPLKIAHFQMLFWSGVVPGILLFLIELLFGGISRAFFDFVIEFQMFHWGYILALTGIPLISLKFLISRLHKQQMERAELNVSTRLKEHFLSRLFSKPIEFFESHYTGELLSRSHDAERFLKFGFRVASLLGQQIIIVSFCSVVLLFMSPLIAAVNLVPFMFMGAWALLAQNSVKESLLRQQQEEGRSQTFLMQRAESYLRFYVMGMQQHLLATCLPTIARRQSARTDHAQRTSLYESVDRSLETLIPAATTFAGSYLLIQGELSYGGFMLVSTIAVLLVSQLSQLSSACRQYTEIRPVAHRTAEVFDGGDEELELLEKTNTFETLEQKVSGSEYNKHDSVAATSLLSIKDLYFGYNGVDADLFRAVSLSIGRGEIVGLSGPSGSGKTTLLEILSGQREMIAGELRFDGHQVAGNVPCGFVFADNGYVEGDLKQLICGQNEVDFDRLADVLRKVELWKRLGFFVETRGVEALEEQHLSQGEVQRLMLAQALYHSSDLILFDEAFSHVSKDQSCRILLRLREMGTTVLLATHREEILALCDHCIDIRRISAP